jgi:hypothetical protein
MLILLCFCYVVIVEDSKPPFLDCRVVPLIYKLVVIECSFPARPKNSPTRGADDLEITSEVVLPNKNKRLTITVEALKSFENNIAHALHMGGPDLV